MSDSCAYVDHADKLLTESITGGSEWRPAKDTEPAVLPSTSGCQATIAVGTTFMSTCSDETLGMVDTVG